QNLLTTSIPRSYHVGTGRQLLAYISASLREGPAKAQHEVIFVTCFWAKSGALEDLAGTLLALNSLHTGRKNKLRVRICISSVSAVQKIFHTSSPRGHTYPCNAGTYRKLGLPPPEMLGGLDVVVKSMFFRPVSVLHGKYVIVDRRRLYLPSCNVSWEEWLEGMGVFEGEVVDRFWEYYRDTWGGGIAERLPLEASSSGTPAGGGSAGNENSGSVILKDTFCGYYKEFPEGTAMPTIFLPQPHHATFPPIRYIPDFITQTISKCLPFQISPKKMQLPSTPQNVFIVELLRNARKSIFIQTPNLTSPFLLDEIYKLATRPGGEPVRIEIVTCRNMMYLEQLVTTGFGGAKLDSSFDTAGERIRWGASTESCVSELLRRVNGTYGMGKHELRVYYYDPLPIPKGVARKPKGDVDIERGGFTEQEQMSMARQSHVKAMVVDEEVVVVGSANGDMASWGTSGEVNVLVVDGGFARGVMEALEMGVGGRRVRWW
ncbi:hypothetical protein DFH27DRAFT_621486, partial [Peziza echinospora]